MLLLDLHTDFSGGRSGGLVFPSLEKFSTVCCGKVVVKGFSVVNKAEVDDVFLELSCFFDDTVDVGNLIPGSSAYQIVSFLFGFSLFISVFYFKKYVYNNIN